VASFSGYYPGNTVTFFGVDGNKLIMDNGRPDRVDIVPFEQYNVSSGNPVFPRKGLANKSFLKGGSYVL
jgi:hypothetical protein